MSEHDDTLTRRQALTRLALGAAALTAIPSVAIAQTKSGEVDAKAEIEALEKDALAQAAEIEKAENDLARRKRALDACAAPAESGSRKESSCKDTKRLQEQHVKAKQALATKRRSEQASKTRLKKRRQEQSRKQESHVKHKVR